jgi:predicted DNA-binding antitoxin AbrB/MazE fold protein
MTNTIETIFENGVFRPLQPVTLPANFRVRIAFEDTTPSEAASLFPPRVLPREYDDELSEVTVTDQEYTSVPPKSVTTVLASITLAGKMKPLPYPEDERR